MRKKGQNEIPLFNEEDRNEIEDKEKLRKEREALFNEQS